MDWYYGNVIDDLVVPVEQQFLFELFVFSMKLLEDNNNSLVIMCCLYNDGRVKEVVVMSNGMMKMLLVMQSEDEGIVRRMCGDLIKILGKNNAGLGVCDSKTTHIMPY
ncbi:hypothetical protein QYF36_009245 [Acer negundo]|nr:hypothetical protein QYF36_009245 [Acer negundo]